MGFKVVSSQIDLPKLEEEILSYWKENRIFEQSITSRPEDKRWTFLDGPPFITGLPHYGTLLSSIPKDIFPRYWTMKGFRVRRVWGWDCHGLPAENKVESILGIKRKKDIEDKIGVRKFIDECKSYVQNVSSEWEWYIDHIGRWADFKNAYKTMDLSYMESVMWVFKRMYDKGYIYKGIRVSLFCPHCSTPISNFEVAMDQDNYHLITEPANVYKYKLEDEDNVYLLAWSTTPWNKIATPALAVNPKLSYVKVLQNGEHYILAKNTLKMLKSDPYKTLQEFKGKDLINKKFVPHYNYYKIEPGKFAFIVVGADFVSSEEGTGVVTLAAYGEEDLEVMKRENIQIVLHVNDEGMIKSDVPQFANLYYLDANKAVNQDLKSRNLLYREDEYSHSVPTCWRCHTRLFYAPQDAWYVDIQTLKPKLQINNEKVNWFPTHFKYGRFLKSMEAAPDWCISRSRYWGSPVPVWECECGERFVPGSIKELESRSGVQVQDLHKPDIDEIKIKCQKCQRTVSRVPEVLDSWIEAGSAPFAERHFPFDNALKLEDFFPPDFIVEYTGQIRAWFYVLHVISTAIYDSNAFKNVLVTGVVLGTDGRKMSKNFGNYPDPKQLMEKYGGDALRIYLMGSPVMKGEDISFSNEGVPETVRNFLLILWNCYKYFIDYALSSDWSCDKTASGSSLVPDLTILDKWILSKLTRLVVDLHNCYESYDTMGVSKLLKAFIVEDLSTWYIRRNRSRISGALQDEKSKNVALSVLYGVLVTYCKLLAPLAPFITEVMYRNLTDGSSVHLSDFPQGDLTLLNEELMQKMDLVRSLVEIGHAQRKQAGVKLRQPLAEYTYFFNSKLERELEEILADELNVKKVTFKSSNKKAGKIDTTLDTELKQEGDARELVRRIQQLRKEAGLTFKDKIRVTTLSLPNKQQLKDLILQQTNAQELLIGDKEQIELVK